MWSPTPCAPSCLPRDGWCAAPRLSHYAWWARHGGVEDGARKESVRGAVPMCHTLQPTSAASQRVDPNTLPPPGKRVCRRPAAVHAAVAREEKWPRYVYVDGLKRAVGECENLDCARDGPGSGKCVAGVEQCFDWEHTKPHKKRKCISELCCQLPANMPEGRWKGKINRELKRGDCKLLCRNCHHLKTQHGMVPTYRTCSPVN